MLKYYKIYDNMRNQFVRQIAKKTMDDEATAVNNLGSVMAFA